MRSGPLLRAVNRALRGLDVQPRDEGAAELARVYAREIDAGEPAQRFGPLLLACLESLLMTPRARAALVKGASDANGQKPTNPLDELRAKRDARKNAS